MGLESVMVIPKGGAEEDLALGSQSQPSVTAMVTKPPEPEIEIIRHGLVSRSILPGSFQLPTPCFPVLGTLTALLVL